MSEISNEHARLLSKMLIEWYETNKRDLPWRHTNNPYLIWLSEIILQQTRVIQGYDYYIRFTERFPTVTDLANADEDEVMKLWEGLGYYSRARNLHFAAKTISNKFSGVFPENYEDIISLKGIGEYTAAAIASFAFNQAYAVVDGNVFRVISRLFDIEEGIDTTTGKKLFTKLAQELLPKNDPATHNQAIMEFGALHCTPISPKCESCPMSNLCIAYANNTIESRPVKIGKTKIKTRYFHYFFIKNGDYTYINKRTANDIWKNLYELPLLETSENTSIEDLLSSSQFQELFPQAITIHKSVFGIKHILSHQKIFANFHTIETETDINFSDHFLKIKTSELTEYAMPRLIKKYMEDMEII